MLPVWEANRPTSQSVSSAATAAQPARATWSRWLAALRASFVAGGRSPWIALAYTLAYTLIYAVAITSTSGGLRTRIDTLGVIPIYMAAPTTCSLAWRKRTPARRAWLCPFLANCAFALNGFAFVVYAPHGGLAQSVAIPHTHR